MSLHTHETMGWVINSIVKNKLKDRISFWCARERPVIIGRGEANHAWCEISNIQLSAASSQEFLTKTDARSTQREKRAKTSVERVFTFHKLLSLTFAYHTSIWIMNRDAKAAAAVCVYKSSASRSGNINRIELPRPLTPVPPSRRCVIVWWAIFHLATFFFLFFVFRCRSSITKYSINLTTRVSSTDINTCTNW